MSYVSVAPEIVSAAADNLQSVGSRIHAQNTAALGATTGLVPAASDEVSVLTAMQFAAHARAYQAVSAQATAIHQMFVAMLAAGAGSYAATEAANAVARLRSVRNGFRNVTAGGQLRSDVRRTRFWADDRRRGNLG